MWNSERIFNHQITKLKITTKLRINSSTQQNFILRSPIIFLTQFFKKNHYKFYLPRYIFKKKIFSFWKPNEIRQSLMDRKKQIFTYKLVFNQRISLLTIYIFLYQN
jgi:hypothetical protein